MEGRVYIVMFLYLLLPFVMIFMLWRNYYKRRNSQRCEIAQYKGLTAKTTGTIEYIGRERKTRITDSLPYTYYWLATVRYRYGGREYVSDMRIYHGQEYGFFGKPNPGDTIGVLLDPEDPTDSAADQMNQFPPGGHNYFEETCGPFILVVCSLMVLYFWYKPFLDKLK